jgi:hypothetical protein
MLSYLGIYLVWLAKEDRKNRHHNHDYRIPSDKGEVSELSFLKARESFFKSPNFLTSILNCDRNDKAFPRR